MATYPDRHQLLSGYPELDDEEIRQTLAYAAAATVEAILDEG